MESHIYCYLSAAGPSDVVADFHTTLIKARRMWPDKGWHWGFGLCDPDGIAPIINDATVRPEDRPPGESYVIVCGIWLCRNWTANNVGLAMNTMSSLWPELTIFFTGAPYEEYRGYRGLWQQGRTVVFDARVDDENPDRDDKGNPVTAYRRVPPNEEHPIPLFYQHDFSNNDPLPPWDEIRSSIHKGVQIEVDSCYKVELHDPTFDRWIEQESHQGIDKAQGSARGYSRHSEERSRIVDTLTGQTIEVWNEGMLEEKNGELL